MFVKNVRYYTGIVYEFNLPTGWTCPFAKECLVKVDKETGRFENASGRYYCYASKAERFPAVRKRRWANFEFAKKNEKIVLPKDAVAVRIHTSGDFFNQDYFDNWIRTARENPFVEFWAYTKWLRYWEKRLGDIPDNLVLTASRGGKDDYLIDKHGLKNVEVYKTAAEVPDGLPIDTNDDYARKREVRKFALIDNAVISKEKQKKINQK